MNKEIKERIETINKGKVPDGYIRTKAGLMPCDWIKSKPLTTNMIFENISDKNHGNEYPVLSATQEKGIVLRSEIEKDINFNKENTNSYKLVCKGDYVISLRSFQGGIEYSNIDGLVSPAYTVIRPIIPISDGYYKEYFKTNDFIDRLNSAIYGIRDGKQIGYKDFAELALHNPPLEEQEKIAEILSRCDTVIEECEKQVEEYKSLKKTCLGKMFPKKGSNIPEIRFPGFTDAWEQRKLGDVVDVQSGKDYKHLSEGNIPVYGTGGYMLSVNKALSYNQDAIGIGRKGTIDKPYVLKAPFWTVDTLFYAIPKDNNELDFLNCIFQNVDWKKKDESTGVPSLSKSTINNVDIFVPDEKEQKSIGEYFNNLDHLITLHQRELEKLQNIKKSLLEKMFV